MSGTVTSTFAGPVSSTSFTAQSPSTFSLYSGGSSLSALKLSVHDQNPWALQFENRAATPDAQWGYYVTDVGELVMSEVSSTSFIAYIGDYSQSLGGLLPKGVYIGENLQPTANNATDFGQPSRGWKNSYVSSTAFMSSARVQDNAITTSTLFVGSLTGQRGQVCLGDMDGSGFTCLTGNDGVMTAYSTSTN